MRELIRRLEEAAGAEWATKGDISSVVGADNFKVGVPALLNRSMSSRQKTAVDDALAQGGVFSFRRGFFYRMGTDADKFAEQMTSDLRKRGFNPTLLASGENWADFSGGARPWTAKDSFWWAVFQIPAK